MFAKSFGGIATAAMLVAGGAFAQSSGPTGQRPPSASQTQPQKGQSQGVPTPQDRSRQQPMLEQIPRTEGPAATPTDPNAPGSRAIGEDQRPTTPARPQSGIEPQPGIPTQSEVQSEPGIRSPSGQPLDRSQFLPAESAQGDVSDPITEDQKVEIRRTLTEEPARAIEPTADMNLAVGAQMPPRVPLQPMPPRIVRLVPAYETYSYVRLADGTILIVDPETHVIVQIIG